MHTLYWDTTNVCISKYFSYDLIEITAYTLNKITLALVNYGFS